MNSGRCNHGTITWCTVSSEVCFSTDRCNSANSSASGLQLGVITPRGLPEPPALVDGSLVVAFGFSIFLFIGTAGFGLATAVGQATPGAAATIWSAVSAGVLLLPILLVSGAFLGDLNPSGQVSP